MCDPRTKTAQTALWTGLCQIEWFWSAAITRCSCIYSTYTVQLNTPIYYMKKGALTNNICLAMTSTINSRLRTYCANCRALWRWWPSGRNAFTQIGPGSPLISRGTIFTWIASVARRAFAMLNFKCSDILSVLLHGNFKAHLSQTINKIVIKNPGHTTLNKRLRQCLIVLRNMFHRNNCQIMFKCLISRTINNVSVYIIMLRKQWLQNELELRNHTADFKLIKK